MVEHRWQVLCLDKRTGKTLHFAPDGRAHMYAAVHFSLVGIRSCFAPFLGFAIFRLFGYRVAFAFSATLLTVAAIIIGRLARRTV